MWHLLNDHGREGYRTRWHAHDFPIAEYKLLETLIRRDG
jgi:hypothetical protein